MPETMQTIAARRTTRSFSSTLPDRKSMDDVLRAAALAPLGGATGIPLRDIRRIFVFAPHVPAREKAVETLYGSIRKNACFMRWLLRLFPFLRRKMGAFSTRLDLISERGIPGFERGTYYVIVAEKKGFPPVGRQSLAHAMQNMWLAATDKGLSFQLVSATGIMSKNRAFMKLLELSTGEYDLDGCLIGYPESEPVERKNDELCDIVTWVDNS
jgi:nitroreductase